MVRKTTTSPLKNASPLTSVVRKGRASQHETASPLTNVVRKTHLQRKTHFSPRPIGRKPCGDGVDQNRGGTVPWGNNTPHFKTASPLTSVVRKTTLPHSEIASPLTSPVRKTALPSTKLHLRLPTWSGKPHFSARNCIPADQHGQGRCSCGQERSAVVPPWYGNETSWGKEGEDGMRLYHGGTITVRILTSLERVRTTVVQPRAFSSEIRSAAVPRWYKHDTD